MDGARSLLTLTNVEDSYTKVCLSDEYAARMAAEQCCDVINATPSMLQLDIDTHRAWEDFPRRMRLLKDLKLIPQGYRVEVWRSKNRNWHVTVHLPQTLPADSRILLQALLGSDLTRVPGSGEL